MTPTSHRAAPRRWPILASLLALLVATGHAGAADADGGGQDNVKPPPGMGDAAFGASVARLGSRIVVGAPDARPGGVRGAGAVYIFDMASGRLLFELASRSPTPDGAFGAAVAAAGPNILVGEPGDSPGGVAGAGSAFVFEGVHGAQVLAVMLSTPVADAEFGHGVSAVGPNFLVLAPGDSPNGVTRAGSVTLFDGRTGDVLISIVSPTPTADAEFGCGSVAIGNDIMIGAPGRSLLGSAERALLFNANLRPKATSQVASTPSGVDLPIQLEGSDPNGDRLRFIVRPDHGTLAGSGASLVYSPLPGYAGADSFTFVVNDGALTSAPATVAITVGGAGAGSAAAPREAQIGGHGACAAGAGETADPATLLPEALLLAGLVAIRVRRRRPAPARTA